MRPAFISALLLSVLHLGIYFTHSTVWLTAAEMCEETLVFPKLNQLTNHNRLGLDMQIVMPRVDNLKYMSRKTMAFCAMMYLATKHLVKYMVHVPCNETCGKMHENFLVPCHNVSLQGIWKFPFTLLCVSLQGTRKFPCTLQRNLSMYLATKCVARYMKISVYLAITLVARYMEIFRYLVMCFIARYTEISMYLAAKLVARYKITSITDKFANRFQNWLNLRYSSC